MLSIIHVSVDKEHRLRKWTPVNVIKYSNKLLQGASYAKMDAYQCYQIFI